MSIIDKTILSKDQPQNTNVLWAKPKDGGGIELNAFNNGKWEKAGGEVPLEVKVSTVERTYYSRANVAPFGAYVYPKTRTVYCPDVSYKEIREALENGRPVKIEGTFSDLSVKNFLVDSYTLGEEKTVEGITKKLFEQHFKERSSDYLIHFDFEAKEESAFRPAFELVADMAELPMLREATKKLFKMVECPELTVKGTGNDSNAFPDATAEIEITLTWWDENTLLATDARDRSCNMPDEDGFTETVLIGYGARYQLPETTYNIIKGNAVYVPVFDIKEDYGTYSYTEPKHTPMAVSELMRHKHPVYYSWEHDGVNILLSAINDDVGDETFIMAARVLWSSGWSGIQYYTHTADKEVPGGVYNYFTYDRSAILDEAVVETPEIIPDKSITKDKLADGVVPTRTSELINDSSYVNRWEFEDHVYEVTCTGEYNMDSGESTITTDKTLQDAHTSYFRFYRVVYSPLTIVKEDTTKISIGVQPIGTTSSGDLLIYVPIVNKTFVHTGNTIKVYDTI